MTVAFLFGEGQPGALLCRVILLLTNSFDLEDGFLTASNLEQVKGYLASAFPGKYSEVLPQMKNCSLESELATVRPGQDGGRFCPLRAAHSEGQAREASPVRLRVRPVRYLPDAVGSIQRPLLDK